MDTIRSLALSVVVGLSGLAGLVSCASFPQRTEDDSPSCQELQAEEGESCREAKDSLKRCLRIADYDGSWKYSPEGCYFLVQSGASYNPKTRDMWFEAGVH